MKNLLGFMLLAACSSASFGFTEDVFKDKEIHLPWSGRGSLSKSSEDLSLAAPNDAYKSYYVDRYTLNLSFDPKSGSIQGSNKILFTVTGEFLNSLQLDAVNMNISDVRWSDGSSLTYQYDQKNLKINLPFDLQSGAKASVEVFYSSLRPESLNVANADASRTDRVNSLYSFTEPDGSRRWFPSHDIPSDKTRTKLFLYVPKDIVIVSNGSEHAPVHLPDGRDMYLYDSNFPIASYLTSIVAAPLKSELLGYHKNIPLLLSAPEYLMPALQKEASRTKTMMQVFESFTQAPYAFEKYRQTVAEGYSASMEHQSATTMGGRRVVGDMSGESVIAHELAHQWFGDLVTCGIWGDIWLNEGFASYLPIVFYETLGEKEDALANLLSNRDWYFYSTNQDNARAISTPDEWPNYNIFDQHSYAKAAMVIHLMRSIANASSSTSNGIEPFSRALGSYLHRHAYKNVRYFDLQKSLEQTTSTSWEKFFKEWILSPGHPVVSAKWEWKEDFLNINLKQEQALRLEKPWGTFSFPLNIQVFAADGTSSLHQILVNKADESYSIQTRKPVVAVVLDPMMIVPGQFTIDQSLAAFEVAFDGAKELFAKATIINAMFNQFDDKALAPVLEELLKTPRHPSVLALLARKMRDRSDSVLLNSAIRIKDSINRLAVKLVLRGDLAGLETWILKKSEPANRESFKLVAAKWNIASRVEEREAYLQGMLALNIEEAQKFALEELKKSKWTDRDRIALISAVAAKSNDVMKPFALSMIENSQTVNIASAFLDALIKIGYSEPEALLLAEKSAVKHRATSMKIRFVKLIALQSNQTSAACESLIHVRQSLEPRFTTDDKESLVPALNAAQLKLGCH